jgi:hypothetical protein
MHRPSSCNTGGSGRRTARCFSIHGTTSRPHRGLRLRSGSLQATAKRYRQTRRLGTRPLLKLLQRSEFSVPALRLCLRHLRLVIVEQCRMPLAFCRLCVGCGILRSIPSCLLVVAFALTRLEFISSRYELLVAEMLYVYPTVRIPFTLCFFCQGLVVVLWHVNSPRGLLTQVRSYDVRHRTETCVRAHGSGNGSMAALDEIFLAILDFDVYRALQVRACPVSNAHTSIASLDR